jgi:hypothetical protein
MEHRTLNDRESAEVDSWLLAMSVPLEGWQCFHTANFDPGGFNADGSKRPCNMPGDEFEAMERYKRFMHERDRRKITWVAAVERNPDWSGVNHGWHLHAVWADLAEIYRTVSFKRWANQWGNNKVSAVKDEDNVRRYVAKYCVKEHCLIEWELNGALWHVANGKVCGEGGGIRV